MQYKKGFTFEFYVGASTTSVANYGYLVDQIILGSKEFILKPVCLLLHKLTYFFARVGNTDFKATKIR